jgi:FixJ family two-component response regulator
VASKKPGISDAAPSVATLFVVDDDAYAREALATLLEAEGYPVAAFASGTEFLEALKPNMQGCVVLDIDLPGSSGLDVQRCLAEQGIELPIIFLTGIGDVPMAAAGLKAGAVDFLEKPVDADTLIEAIRRGLSLNAQRGEEKVRQRRLDELYANLTPREKEILVLLARGYSAKQVGKALGISHRTAEIHRGRVMEKLAVDSLADLVALAIYMGIREEK